MNGKGTLTRGAFASLIALSLPPARPEFWPERGNLVIATRHERIQNDAGNVFTLNPCQLK